MVIESIDINSLFANLQSLGFYNYLLPFLLIFTILFAILEKTKLMGTEGEKPRTNINTLLALIIGLIVVVQTDIVMIMNQYLSKMSLFIVIVLIFLLVLGVFGANVGQGWSGGFAGFIAFVICVIAVIWALAPDLGFGFFSNYYIFSDADKALLLFITIFIAVIWLVTKSPNKEPGHRNPLVVFGDEVFNRPRSK
jgi:hypothetical protein